MGKNAVLQITLRATGSEDRRVCNSEKRTIGQHTWDTNVRIFATIDADPGANKSAIIRAISYSPATTRDHSISPQNSSSKYHNLSTFAKWRTFDS